MILLSFHTFYMVTDTFIRARVILFMETRASY